MGPGLKRQRLARLEEALPVAAADRGSYCLDCGGLTIEDAFLLMHAPGDTALDAEAAAVADALALSADRCVRCGELTLIGALRKDPIA